MKKTKNSLVGNPEMTGKWEQYLAGIGQGKKTPTNFLKQVKESIPITFKNITQTTTGNNLISKIKSDKNFDVGEYHVLEKKALFEVTKDGEDEHFHIWKMIAGKTINVHPRMWNYNYLVAYKNNYLTFIM